MTRRFDIGPLLVALGAVALLVSLFLDWYGDRTAWDAFELTDLVLAGLALGALVVAVGMLVPEAPLPSRRWLAPLAVAAAVVVIAQILSPPPQVGGADPQRGAWLGFGSAIAMLAGAVLSLARVSFSVSFEGRDTRRRVAAVDHRPPPTETGSIVARRPERATTTERIRPAEDEPGEAAPEPQGRRGRRQS
jgi:peptidoglycan/LPS O-acetylase OafA/YrhL